ncbi:MAG: InlB B-repeat-containing protein [Candidatus Methanomethylophilaceae archaeon]|nr:InlB B-repeat-containing protein [Candidatus Methanomethylophilaceae archaeon]
MKQSDRRALFAVLVVALLLAVSLSSLGMNYTTSDAGIGVIVPEEQDYAYKLTTDRQVINGVSGETIVKVEYWDENKEYHLIYSDNIYKNLLYTTDDPSIINPNTSEFFKFDELTGIGPFNSFYAAINIGDTSHNGDEHKLSSVNGQIAYILNAYNLDQAIISDTEGVGAYTGLKDNVAYYDEWEHSDYNVMLFIPTVYWHAADKDDSDESYLWLTNKPNFFDTVPGEDVDPNKMEARAHTVMGKVSPYLALGVYEASVRGDKLVSQSDMNPENYKSISQFRNLSNKLNEGIEGGTYMIWNFYQWTLYKMMSYTVIGTKNSQVAIGMGVVTSSTASLRITGQGDAQGPYWGGKNLDGSGSYTDGRHGSKLFLENSWGSFHDLLDDTWTFDGQLHAGHNDSDYINEHINPDASYWDGNQPRKGSDEGLNEIQQLLGNAKINDSKGNGSLIAIASTYTNPEYWDFPDKVGGNAYAGIASSVQYTSGNQTLCVGGHYDARDTGGLNRINIRNSFGMGKLDIGTRLAYVTTGGAITFTAGEYTVDTDKGEVFSGMSVQEGTEVVITATGADDITAVFINGEKLQKTGTVFKFNMPDMDVHLEVIVGNKIPIPEPSSYIYDGSTHSALYGNDYYTITGVNTAKNAGQYAVTLTPIEGFKWLDGTTTAKELPWAIEKRTLMVEGSSAAKIVKVFDGTTNLVMDHVDSLIERDDLFIHGLAEGEIPEFVYTGSYDNRNAGVYKKINITSFSMNASDTYNPDNYIYTFIKFVIVGTDVVITAANLDFDGHIADVTVPYVYSGEENTPEPVVRFKDLWNLTKNKDFSYEYTDNINAGTATVRAVGVGNYSGSVSTTFTIDKLVIEWPEIVEKEYNGEVQTAGLLNTDYYTVVSDASGKEISLDGYPATLRLISPNNTRWVDSESSDRTAVALKITDKSNPLTFRFEEMGSWIANYEWPRAYMSSSGLTLPGREKVVAASKQGYERSFEGWYVTGDSQKTLVTEIPAGAVGARDYTALFVETPLEYDVIFEMQGHGVQVPAQSVQYQGKVVKPEDPQTVDYCFGGWFKNSNYTTPWNFDEDVITNNEHIFAKWTI